jgi:hypothetical protein
VGGAYLSELYIIRPLHYCNSVAFIMANKDVNEVEVTFCSSILGCRCSWKWKRKLLLYYLSQSSSDHKVLCRRRK